MASEKEIVCNKPWMCPATRLGQKAYILSVALQWSSKPPILEEKRVWLASHVEVWNTTDDLGMLQQLGVTMPYLGAYFLCPSRQTHIMEKLAANCQTQPNLPLPSTSFLLERCIRNRNLFEDEPLSLDVHTSFTSMKSDSLQEEGIRASAPTPFQARS
jgi:hypothetical protein